MNLTKENAPAATEARFDTRLNRNYKRLPPYGKQFMAIRKAGKAPARMVIVAFDWDLGRAYPRIIIPSEISPADLEFIFLAGLCVQITYRNKDAHRVPTVAQEIEKVNPRFLTAFALDLAGSGNAWTIIKSFGSLEIAEAA